MKCENCMYNTKIVDRLKNEKVAKSSKEIEAFLIHSFNTVISHLFNSRKLQKNEIKKNVIS